MQLYENYSVTKITDKTWMIDESGLSNMYLLIGKNKALLIDTGTGSGNLKGLVDSLVNLPYDVVLTHSHVDHAGGIGQFPRIWVHRSDIESACSITLQNRIQYIKKMIMCGAVNERSINLQSLTESRLPGEINPLNDGNVIDLGGRHLEVIWTPGHTEGSICFLDWENRILFSGDTLQPITLVIAPGEDRRSILERWLNSAIKLNIKQEKFDTMAGGHGIVSKSVIPDLIACGKGILDGSITPKQTNIHIFNTLFAHYKDIYLTYLSSYEVLDKVLAQS